MKIRCISDNISEGNSPFSIIKWSNNSELEITIDKVYTVIGITKLYGIIFYYILSDETNDYPLAFPYYLFKIEENKVSKYWETSLSIIEEPELIKIENGQVISFKEWTLKKDLFYENLLEGDQEEVRIFNIYRDKMLSE
jgi:hypothetical protein